ncbi:MAG: DNA-binding response regulator, LuxR family [Candidatus Ozemobacter sibiricus]|uniref:DNA-binding response regulator, LuxR family n=1 Tax=Candidatus Ozemobacter sibiricus TaxID=2268124 RepID=A0A367ZMN1_9BACT|nr:MAG: DNA-binding response regulator, LuxR family [Candidatus Ozemobacter sibiricus]
MIRVLVVDDHPLLRKGLCETAAETTDIQVVGEAADGAAALQWLDQHPCDVVTLDLSLPGLHGLDVLEQIRARHKGVNVLVMTMHAEEHYAARAFKLGAAGFLPKDAPPATFIEAVRKIASGGRYIPPDLAERLLFRDHRADRPPHEILSHREFMVLKMIGAGKAPREIGEALAISVKTVSTYRARILEKLHKKTGADLVKYCIEHHLLEEQG